MNQQIKSFKKILKDYIPPIFFKIRQKLKGVKVAPPVWSGDYETWEEAKALCLGYDHQVILEKVKNSLIKVKMGEAVYERDSVLFDQVQYSWGLLAGLQHVALENDGELCVLDFGGSLGSSYFQNKAFLGRLKNLKWCIVEQRHFVTCGRENFEDDQLKFYFSIEECLALQKPNVVILSGVLQYLENPYEWIKKIIEHKIDYIIVDLMGIVDPSLSRNVLTVQNVPESIYRASYPCWFFNENKLNAAFEDQYNLIAGFDCDLNQDISLGNDTNAKYRGYIYSLK